LSIGHNNVFHEEEAKTEDRRKGRGGCDSVRRGELEKMKKRRRAVMLGRFWSLEEKK
jgi:hypothetical protein